MNSKQLSTATLDLTMKTTSLTLAQIFTFTANITHAGASEYVRRVPRTMTDKLREQSEIWERECLHIQHQLLRAIAILERDERNAGLPLEEAVAAPSSLSAAAADSASTGEDSILHSQKLEDLISSSVVGEPMHIDIDEDDLDDLFGASPPIDASSLLGSVPTLDSTDLSTASLLSTLPMALGDASIDVDLSFLASDFSPASSLVTPLGSLEGLSGPEAVFGDVRADALALAALLGQPIDSITQASDVATKVNFDLAPNAMDIDISFDHADMEALLESLGNPP